MAFPALRSALRPARSYFPLGVAAFSSSAPSSSRRQVLVQLIEEVEGLGYPADKVLVNPGRARNQLIPTGQARFVPWKRPSDRIPEKRQRPVEAIADDTAPSSPTSHPPTAPEIVAALAALPVYIDFPHRTISPTSSSIHGSVTLADISKKLEEEHGIPPSAVDVYWRNEDDQARMKELGRWEVEIAPKGGEEVVILGVHVTRLE